MPANIVKSFAKKSGETEEKVDSLWNEIIIEIKEKYGYEDGDENLYKLTTSVLKKRLKLEGIEWYDIEEPKEIKHKKFNNFYKGII